jgi:LacI family transcriptional regulator/LacI family repressor for deo operon, udp, cdd, tsx, nupC, and nupG
LATIKDVAELAQVSTATVSYVLNGTGVVTEATRQRVLAAVATLNYQPNYAARSLRSRSHTLGLALPAEPGRLADPALAEVLASLADTASTHGYALLLATPQAGVEPGEFCVNLVRSGRVDGLVLLDMQTDDARQQALSAAGLPHICAGPAPNGSLSPFVMLENYQDARQAIAYLARLGHQRIALIQLPSELADSEPRYQGYCNAIEEAGLPLEPMYVVEAGRREQDGYEAMRELLSLPERPTAVLACSDELAFGAMHALYDAGLEIGKDVSLVGFDDVPLAAHMHPPLTTLRQPRRKMGEKLATMLIEVVEGKAPTPHTLVLQSRLIVRQSTGTAPER